MAYFELSHAAIEAIVVVGVPLYCAMQVWTLLALRDGCRFAALLPVLIAISLVASAAEGLATQHGPSIRTLIFFAPAATGYLAGLAGLAGLSAIARRLDWHDPARALAAR